LILYEEEIEGITMAGYYPGSKSIWIKIIADRKSRRILSSWTITNRVFSSYSNGHSLWPAFTTGYHYKSRK